MGRASRRVGFGRSGALSRIPLAALSERGVFKHLGSAAISKTRAGSIVVRLAVGFPRKELCYVHGGSEEVRCRCCFCCCGFALLLLQLLLPPLLLLPLFWLVLLLLL